MKIAILIGVLVCMCSVSIVAQINPKVKSDTVIRNLPGFYFSQKSAVGLPKGHDIPAGLRLDKLHHDFLPGEIRHAENVQNKSFGQNRMPCLKPEGAFSMITVCPDSTTTYTMLIKEY